MDIEKEINDIMAPITRAYSNLRIETISVKARDMQEKTTRFTVVFTADRNGTDIVAAMEELIDNKPDIDDGSPLVSQHPIPTEIHHPKK